MKKLLTLLLTVTLLFGSSAEAFAASPGDAVASDTETGSNAVFLMGKSGDGSVPENKEDAGTVSENEEAGGTVSENEDPENPDGPEIPVEPETPEGPEEPGIPEEEFFEGMIIHYVANGDNAVFSDGEKVYDAKVPLGQAFRVPGSTAGYAGPILKRPGFTLAGFSTGQDGKGKSYALNKSYPNSEPVGAELTLYAKWTAGTYKLLYDLKGGKKGAGSAASVKGNASSLTITDASKKDAGFQGWLVNGEGKEGEALQLSETTPYSSPEASARILTLMKEGALEETRSCTLTACYRVPFTEKILFDCSGEEGLVWKQAEYEDHEGKKTASTEIVEAVYAPNTAYLAPIPGKADSLFLGYAKTRGAAKADYKAAADGSVSLKNIAVSEETLTLYPVFKASWSYRVNYDLKGGAWDGAPFITEEGAYASLTGALYNYGASYAAPVPERTGYTFAGWGLTESSAKFKYNAKTGLVTIKNAASKETQKGSTLTLYAVWKPLTVKIQYELNGGKKGAGSTASFKIPAAVKLGIPAKKDSGFQGWYLADGRRLSDALPAGSFTGDGIQSAIQIPDSSVLPELGLTPGGILYLSAKWFAGSGKGSYFGATTARGRDVNTIRVEGSVTAPLAPGDLLYVTAINRETGTAEYVLRSEPVVVGEGGKLLADLTLTQDPNIYGKVLTGEKLLGGSSTGAFLQMRPDLLSLSFSRKEGQTYVPVTSPSYMRSPEVLAGGKGTGFYNPGKTKKGLQGADYLWRIGNQAVEIDYPQLRGTTDHVFLNLYMQNFIKGGPSDTPYQAAYPAINFYYNGKYYLFNDTTWATVQKLNSYGISVTVQVCLGWSEQTKNLIHHKARTKGKFFYAFENEDQQARETLEAAFAYLGGVMGNPSFSYTSNWILGNEVNSYKAWMYAGSMKTDEFYTSYEETFHIFYNAIKASNPDARVYACVDHCWTKADAGYTAKGFLDRFRSDMARLDPACEWNIAFHPYAMPLSNTAFWNGSNTTDSPSTPYISMLNINQLTQYASASLRRCGETPGIILSEFGYNYSSANPSLQAKALAYSYAIASANPDIDAIHIRSLTDDPTEVRQGLHFGLAKMIAGPNLEFRPSGQMYFAVNRPETMEDALALADWSHLPGSVSKVLSDLHFDKSMLCTNNAD